ncbi:hypothetical protein [Jatrophihabitans sp.]|uniref:DUF6916 family protein n=1 Tax=Jatrophihabitans sp. TaxID=1932789 RepID=UPI0030C70497
MGLSRRGFLAGTATGLLVVAVPVESVSSEVAAKAASTPAAGGAWRPTGAQRPVLIRDAFTPLLHQHFQLRSDGPPRAVALVEIADLAGSPAGDEARCFSLIFEAKPGNPVEAGMRTVHAGRHSVELFLVPVGRGIHLQRYQAIINNPWIALTRPPVRPHVATVPGENS